jgi:glycogen synthase
VRIAFVTPEYVTEPSFSGGLANYVHRVSLSLLELGHQPVVVVRSDRNESFLHDGIEVHRVTVEAGLLSKVIGRLTGHRFTASVDFLRSSYMLNGKVKKIHQSRRISIVQHTHLGGIGFFRPRGIPSVVRLSSYTPLWRVHGAYDHMLPIVLRQQELWERLALKRADAVFGPCREVAAVVQTDLRRPVEIIETPFVLDTEESDEAMYQEMLQGKTYLLYVGRFNVTKGMATIADTLPELLSRHPDLRFVFLGREQGGYKGGPMVDYIKEKAGRHQDRVLFPGSIRHHKLYPIMKNAVAVVMPSLVENFPNVCLEAMAHGKVVVGTRGTGFEQLIVEGESGILCDPGNPPSLLEAMERAIGLSDRERQTIGERARERIADLRPEKAVTRLTSFYKGVIAGKTGSRIS